MPTLSSESHELYWVRQLHWSLHQNLNRQCLKTTPEPSEACIFYIYTYSNVKSSQMLTILKLIFAKCLKIDWLLSVIPVLYELRQIEEILTQYIHWVQVIHLTQTKCEIHQGERWYNLSKCIGKVSSTCRSDAYRKIAVCLLLISSCIQLDTHRWFILLITPARKVTWLSYRIYQCYRETQTSV